MQTAKKLAEAYSKFGVHGTSLLAFREIPHLIDRFVEGDQALDYGCGTGRSTRFIEDLGFQTCGVDNCKFFLEIAKNKMNRNDQFFLVKNDRVPFKDSKYDFVFSSFVLLMIPTKDKMKKVCKEIYRVLKPGGIFIAITGNEYMHCPKMNWVSYETDFPENYDLKRGAPAKLKIRDNGAVFSDFNWYDEDYRECMEAAGFKIEKCVSPKARKNERGEWFSEKTQSPFLVYVARKKAAEPGVRK